MLTPSQWGITSPKEEEAEKERLRLEAIAEAERIRKEEEDCLEKIKGLLRINLILI